MAFLRPTVAKVLRQISHFQPTGPWATTTDYYITDFKAHDKIIGQQRLTKSRCPTRPSYKPKLSAISRKGRATPRCLRPNEGITLVGCDPLRIRCSGFPKSSHQRTQQRVTLMTQMISNPNSEIREPSASPIIGISEKLRTTRFLTPMTPSTPRTILRTMMSGPRPKKQKQNIRPVIGVASKLQKNRQTTSMTPMTLLTATATSDPYTTENEPFMSPIIQVFRKLRKKRVTKPVQPTKNAKQLTPLTQVRPMSPKAMVRAIRLARDARKRGSSLNPINDISENIKTTEQTKPVALMFEPISSKSEYFFSPIIGALKRLRKKRIVTPTPAKLSKPMTPKSMVRAMRAAQSATKRERATIPMPSAFEKLRTNLLVSPTSPTTPTSMKNVSANPSESSPIAKERYVRPISGTLKTISTEQFLEPLTPKINLTRMTLISTREAARATRTTSAAANIEPSAGPIAGALKNQRTKRLVLPSTRMAHTGPTSRTDMVRAMRAERCTTISKTIPTTPYLGGSEKLRTERLVTATKPTTSITNIRTLTSWSCLAKCKPSNSPSIGVASKLRTRRQALTMPPAPPGKMIQNTMSRPNLAKHDCFFKKHIPLT